MAFNTILDLPVNNVAPPVLSYFTTSSCRSRMRFVAIQKVMESLRGLSSSCFGECMSLFHWYDLEYDAFVKFMCIFTALDVEPRAAYPSPATRASDDSLRARQYRNLAAINK